MDPDNAEMGTINEERVCFWFSISQRFYHAKSFTSVENLGEMAAVGLGLPRETFKEAGRYGYIHLPLIIHSS